MKFSRNHLAALTALLVLASGCAKKTEQTSQEVTPTPAPAERIAYQGTMNGNATTVVVDPTDNRYVVIETLPATTAGGAAEVRRTEGRWVLAHGTATDPNATVYEFTPSGGGPTERFWVRNDTELHLLGPDNKDLADVVMLSKATVPDEVTLARRITAADAGATVTLRPGEQIVLVLPVPGAGQNWAWADSSAVPLQRVDLAGSASLQNGANQAIAFQATQQGSGQLKLQAPPKGSAAPKEFAISIVVE